MPYLIDGHNLIGAFPGLALADPEDERKLLQVLEDFGRFSRRKMVVYFDRGQVGMGPLSTSGRMVRAHFIPPPRQADDAIVDFLRRRKDARQYTVISSDSEIRIQAQRAGAKVISSKVFAHEVLETIRGMAKEKPPEEPEDIEHWLQLFNK